ncbi:EAL domain-containing protein [Nitrosovibrio sp. Nv4]|uniref:EAL domain-containing protein n=1 Tax=Nitrosovibrio sp. Nv4 TaxID=1945880 RepID=UPI000BCB412B|nr:EAL domain-containing protein [Nitrosovibrio sp. Nv4]SOD40705.1 EAL domain, c-di-GMP-specific phosphodiesterase class I (or its enzymatically inactive variant) [Nitrosovibrio sp. Nv4]
MSVSAEKQKDGLARFQSATDYKVQRAEDGSIVGHFFNCWLSSIFQPVFDANTRKAVGHAAYVRSMPDEGNQLSPWRAFALTESDAPLVRFDRLCRAVHALNYFSGVPQRGSLFVSVQPRLLESVKDDHGRTFKRTLDIIGVKTSQVTIEIPIEVNRNWKLLKHVISNYRSHGYRIVINHSGMSENWLAELASLYPLYPDLVRLEASNLLRHSGTESLVDTIHHFGAEVLVHEIETRQQLTAALHTGADFLQGRLFGMPARAIEAEAFALLPAAATEQPLGAPAAAVRHNRDAVGVQDVYV